MNSENLEFPPVLLKASAGTGKTFNLSNRYISLLVAGESPSKVLATTFTKKAAGEIQDRVFARLATAALDEEAAKELGSFLHFKGFNSNNAAEALHKLANQQHLLNICTLDSFFFQIASNFSFELGLPANWQVAEPGVSKEIIRNAVKQLCRSRDSKELATLLRLLNKGETKQFVHRQIEREVSSLYRLSYQAAEEAWSFVGKNSFLKNEELNNCIEFFSQFEVPKNKQGKPNRNWQKAIDKTVSEIEAGDWLSFVSAGIAEKIILSEDLYYKIEIPFSLKENYLKLIAHAKAYFIKILQDQTFATKNLIEFFRNIYEAQLKKEGVLGFDDIEYQLLDANFTADLSEIYYRLDSQIHHLLLDEFQDTSRNEWFVLKPIVEELLSKSGLDYSFFCVGDAKQAIYGWRGGVAEIFDVLESNWPHLNTDTTELSYRSSKAVIRTVNKVFSNLAKASSLEEHSADLSSWLNRFSEHQTTKDCLGYACLKSVELEEESDLLKTAAGLVKDLLAKNPNISIGVLTRTNKTVAEMIFQLTEKGIKASEEGGMPLSDSPAVCSILSLFRLCDHPGDEISAFYVIGTPLAEIIGFREFRNKEQLDCIINGVREDILHHGLGFVIFRLAQSLAESCNERDLNRLMQLVDLAYSYQNRLSERLNEFVEHVKATRVPDPKVSNVRVMTVHQAKGLEFDAVVLPELDTKLFSQLSQSMLTYFDEPLSKATRVFRNAPKKVLRLEPRLEEMVSQKRSEEIKESLSVMYVALTRAVHGMYMFVPNDSRKKQTYSEILKQTLTDESSNSSDTLYESGDESWFLSVKQREESAADRSAATYKKHLGLKTLSHRKKGLERETPSSKEGRARVNFKDSFASLDSNRYDRGLAIHRLFEELSWLEEFDADRESLANLLMNKGYQESLINNSVDHFLSAISNEKYFTLFSKASYIEKHGLKSAEVFLEREFIYRDKNKIVQGVFDRLVISYSDARAVFAEVIDYKTDAIKGEKELAQKIEFYKPQIETYKSAVSAIYGIEPEEVKGCLVFTDVFELVKV